VCQSEKLNNVRVCNGVIPTTDVVNKCVKQRIHQVGGLAGFVRIRTDVTAASPR
jgi:hypothetical protein